VENNYQSMYALDYLKHKAVFGFSHKIWRNFGASWTVKYESRNGTYSRYIDSEIQTFDYKPFTTADVSVFWKNSMVEIYAKANNFTDTQYFEIGGVQMPGRWILGGVKLKLSKL
jgi:iron complex outermembrane receptor protein